MKVVLLGSGGYHPSDRRQTACIMLPSEGLLLDAGTALYRVPRWIETTHLDILLTHAHLDHCIGLTFLFDVLHTCPDIQQIRVHAEPSKIEAIKAHLFSDALFPVTPPFRWSPLANELELPSGGRVTHFPLQHPGGSVGYRIDWPAQLDQPARSLAYVTDTTAGPDKDYLARIQGVDLLIHECYFPDGEESHAELTGHSSTTPVAEVAAQANVGRLVLVHVNPLTGAEDPIGLSTARDVFPNTDLGTDGLEIDF